MSWDAPPPGEPQQPPQQQPYAPTQPYGQPYGQQPQWGQAPGQPPSSGQGQGQYGGPYFPPYQGYPPPRRNRYGWLIGLGAVGVVVAVSVAIGIALTTSSSGTPIAVGTSSPTTSTPSDTASASASASPEPSQDPHTVIVPDGAGPMNLLTNSDTAQRISQIESSLIGNVAYSNPQIGFYTVGSDSDYSVWMLAEDTSGISVFQNSVNTLGDAAMARQIAAGAKMTNVTTESPGPLGGAMLCGKLAISGAQFRVCEWVDDTTFGWVYFMPTVSDGDVLTYTLDLRGAAEQ